MLNLVTVSEALGDQEYRARGIRDWSDVAALGSNNIELLLLTAREAANQAMADGDRDQARSTRLAIKELDRLLKASGEGKPLLPRLRRESFRVGQSLRVFVGELLDQKPAWRLGRVGRIEKAFRPEWKGSQPNSGYYWRVTAVLDSEVMPGVNELPFSTSEPRVLLEKEWDYLVAARSADRRFVEVFAANAWRDWTPLWCQELGISIDSAAMEYESWLSSA